MEYSKKEINEDKYKYLLKTDANYFKQMNLEKHKLGIGKIAEKFRSSGANVKFNKKDKLIKTIYEYTTEREAENIKNVNIIKQNGDVSILLYVTTIPKHEEGFIQNKLTFVMRMISNIEKINYKEKVVKYQALKNVNYLFMVLKNETSSDILSYIYQNKKARFRELELQFKKNPNSINYALKGLIKEGIIEEKKKSYIMTSKGRDIFNILVSLENILQ